MSCLAPTRDLASPWTVRVTRTRLSPELGPLSEAAMSAEHASCSVGPWAGRRGFRGRRHAWTDDERGRGDSKRVAREGGTDGATIFFSETTEGFSRLKGDPGDTQRKDAAFCVGAAESAA